MKTNWIVDVPRTTDYRPGRETMRGQGPAHLLAEVEGLPRKVVAKFRDDAAAFAAARVLNESGAEAWLFSEDPPAWK